MRNYILQWQRPTVIKNDNRLQKDRETQIGCVENSCRIIVGDVSISSTKSPLKKRGRVWFWEIKSWKINVRKRGAAVNPISQKAETSFWWLSFRKKIVGGNKLKRSVESWIQNQPGSFDRCNGVRLTLFFSDRLFYSFQRTFSYGMSHEEWLFVVTFNNAMLKMHKKDTIEACDKILGK